MAGLSADPLKYRDLPAQLRPAIRRIVSAKDRIGFRRRPDPRLGERYHSLNDLDRRLEKYLDFDGGFFIEAGANDGIAQSNTLYFERNRGWRGLMIEPIPALARLSRLNRPGSVTVNTALGPNETDGSKISMTYCNLMSVADGAMGSVEEQESHIRVGAEIQKVVPYRVSVRCASLNALLKYYGIGRVDLLSLDVEGFESEVLGGLDFDRWRPRYLLVEARFRDKVDAKVMAHYRVVEQMTDKDVLYGVRSELSVPYSVGWRYVIGRRIGRYRALYGLYD